MLRSLVVSFSLFSFGVYAGELVEPAYRRDALNWHSFPAPPALRADVVASAEPSQVELMTSDARRVGSVQKLSRPLTIDLGNAAAHEAGKPAWSGIVRASSPDRSRLGLLIHSVSPGTVGWVSRSDGSEWVGFDIADAGFLWTPSIRGEDIRLTVESAESVSFDILSVATYRTALAGDPACFNDGSCYGESDAFGIDIARAAIAQMTFIKNGGVYICTGGLINDKGAVDAYFLTANHCVASAAEAASVEFVWDAYTASCGGTPRSEIYTYGAQLLATSTVSDVTLLRLLTLPAGRALLGWDSRPQAVANGTTLYRLSHPGTPSGDNWYLQVFAKTVVDTSLTTCSALSRPAFLYQRQVVGGAGPGSSGAPLLLPGGYIVGQLAAACGPTPSDVCNSSTKIVDGAFSVSWPVVAAFIDNAPAAQPQTCQTDGRTLCLNNGRFAVTVTWRDFNARTGTGTAVPFSGDTGYFWFFDSKNVEVVVKVLDGRGLNNHFWVFYGALSNVEYTVTILDVQTGRSKSYANRLGAFGSVGDTTAFPGGP